LANGTTIHTSALVTSLGEFLMFFFHSAIVFSLSKRSGGSNLYNGNGITYCSPVPQSPPQPTLPATLPGGSLQHLHGLPATFQLSVDPSSTQ
jgi:hypothetical protein